jgi:hypothetical protein
LPRSVLKIELRPGEAVSIGDFAVITLEEKSGKIARFAIEAEKSVQVQRVNKPSAAQFAAEGGITGKPT